MTEAEKKFADFFKQAYDKAVMIADEEGNYTMSYQELDAWTEELEAIVFQAKAELQGADFGKRERRAKLKESEREKTKSSDGMVSVSDSINAVKKRADRMSQRDKLEASYRNLHMDEATIKELLKNVKVDEKSQAIHNNVVSFNKDKKDAAAIDTAAAKLTESLLKEPEPKEPFDPSKLFG